MQLTISPFERTRRPPDRAPVLTAHDVFSAEECDAILRLADTFEVVPAAPSYDATSLTELTDRKGTARWLPDGERTRWIYERFDAVAVAANQTYGFDLTEIEPLQLSRYGIGDHFGTHTDFGFVHASRQLSASIQLTASDAYEGGDLEFVGAHFDVGDGHTRAAWDRVQGRGDRALGSVVIFPAWLAHRVTPVTRGVRHSLVAWVRGVPYG